ncbi:ICS [Coprinopsis cinerea okayama7|uniref:ICS n=1 Tax=Coprinopsis cinerea (strain Okayama-7 / 130 / ATCC MYA-4618 / FGSC 9003) TaxID=240176 RepID=D6RQ71_COPC7|nr:ICS [Coprinopsis cinerea okayama7\|eukprot:XP_002910338.1 ICS [Coprinopsis cinerea okayama7\
MARNVEELKSRREGAIYSETWRGRLLTIAGRFFAIYCVTRVVSCTYNVLFLPSQRSTSNLHYSDLLSNALAYGISRIPSISIQTDDIASFSRQLSLIFVGIIILTSVRYILRGVSRSKFRRVADAAIPRSDYDRHRQPLGRQSFLDHTGIIRSILQASVRKNVVWTLRGLIHGNAYTRELKFRRWFTRAIPALAVANSRTPPHPLPVNMCADCQNVVPPPTRSLSSATFSRPPLDMSLNLPELVEWHETHSALHPVFAYPVSGGHVEVLRWFEVALLVRHEARRLRTLLESKAVTQGFHIVALVINCVGVTHVIRGSEPGLVSLVSEAVELLKASSTTISLPSVSELPPFTHPRDLVSATDLPYQRRSINEVQLYVHSSGDHGYRLAWSRDASKVRQLRELMGVIYGGGPLNKEVGDSLVSEGIAVYPLYGRNSDWEYFRFASNTTVEMVPSGDGYFEFVMLCNSYNSLRVTNTTIRGRPAYATSDLFEKHPSKPGYWKVYGRFLDSVAPTVQRVNAVVPRHSRILRDMILVSDPGKPFQYTAKGTPRRQIILKDYQAEVASLYKGQKSSPNFDREPAETWDFQSILELVRFVVRKAVDAEILNDDSDLFQHGLDSFHATCVRHALLHNLPSLEQIEHDHAIENFVYRYPTITKLAVFLAHSISGSDTPMSAASVESKVGAMKAMVKVHGRDFLAPAKVCSCVSSSQMLDDEARVVLITGTTGTLGSHLLLELNQDPRIQTIYALNRGRRGGKAALVAQQIAVLSDMDIDGQALLTSERIVLLEADLSATRFGLSPETFEQMKRSVTHIVHNAWPVHFNLSLESFEPSIRDLRCLIDFVLASPRVDKPKFIFTSTIGVFRGSSTHGEFLEESIPPQVAVGMGYTESKWVAEEIILEAVRTANLPALVVRVGQLTSSNGNIWKVGEWFPTLVQGSVLLGCLPQLVGTISWLPAKDAAQVIKEYMDHPWQDPIVHLVHPTPISWEVIESALSHQLNLPVAQYQDWLARLETLESRCHADGTMPSKAMARDALLSHDVSFDFSGKCGEVVFEAAESRGTGLVQRRCGWLDCVLEEIGRVGQ